MEQNLMNEMQNQGDKNSVEPDRKMATIVTVAGFEEIPKATNINLVTFKENNWKVVTKKNEFKIDDLAIYFSIGSIMDTENKEFDFLSNKPLKTKKILGAISQGLVGPISWLVYYNVDITKIKPDDDMTSIMKVKKYVASIEEHMYNLSKDRQPFPKSIVPQTEEERIQNIPKRLKELYLSNPEIIISKKFDGTSFTAVYMKNKNTNECKEKEYVFLPCGRTQVLLTEYKDDPNYKHYFVIIEKYDLEKKMESLGINIALQGEICGPKVNANRMKLPELDFHVFNIWSIDEQMYLPFKEVSRITGLLGLKMVDILYKGPFRNIPCLETIEYKKDLNSNILSDKLLEFSSKQEYSKGIIAEGIVIKTDYGNEYPRCSFKVLSNKYLIKHEII
jgi:RNA ligase (TIGR02306 family)